MSEKGIYVDEKTRTLFIDVIPLLETSKNKKNYESDILNKLQSYNDNIVLKEICVFIGKNFTISMFEKETYLVTSMINFFYNAGMKIDKCTLYYIPSSFSTVFSMIKPLISTNALNLIYFENKSYDEWYRDSKNSQYSFFS